MGVGSLVAPFVTGPLVRRIAPGHGRAGTVLVAAAVTAGVATTVGDVVRQRREHGGQLPEAGTLPSDQPAPTTVRSRIDALGLLTGGSAVAAVGSTALAAASVWTMQTSATRLARLSPFGLRTGALTYLAAIAGWDLIYYWNHRLAHESRWLWAVHVVHHSSERYTTSLDGAAPAGHRRRDIATGIAAAPTWSDRFDFLLRGPGWAYARREQLTPARHRALRTTGARIG